jgi:hypothetical protein
MRSVTRGTAAALVLALAGCGDYSTEDLRFLAALPTRADLQVAVPAGAGQQALAAAEVGSQAATACPLRRADVWLWAKPTSDGINAGVHFIVSLVDVIRKIKPTAREDDLRRWGPFPDDKHPGHEVQVIITRSYPTGPDAPVHAYRFQVREGGGPFLDVISGSFEGASAARGRGSVVLDFEAMWTLHTNDPTTPHGTMQILYDRASDPATIELQLTNDGFGIVRFGYGFAGYRDGRGQFDYAFRDGNGNLLEVNTSFDGSGAGRDRVAVTAAGQTVPAGFFNECWDASACLTYVEDPLNLSCPVRASCSFGAAGSCAEVPAPPF